MCISFSARMTNFFETTHNLRATNIDVLFIIDNLWREIEVIGSHFGEHESYFAFPGMGNLFYAEALFGSRIVKRFASAALIARSTRSASLKRRLLYLKSASLRYCCMYPLPMW